MALFGSKKSETQEQTEIRPMILTTSNVTQELNNIADSNKVAVSSLDFRILAIETLARKDDDKDEHFVQISFEDLKKLSKSPLLLQPYYQLKQSYEIEVFTKRESSHYDDFYFSIGANATLCKVFLTVKEGSSLRYTPNFQEDMLDLINKKKIRAKIMIGLFDEMVEAYIAKLHASLMLDQVINFEKSEIVLVAQGMEPVATINDDLKIYFDEKQKQIENDKVDYSQRSFIHSVVQDELLIEYIKPIKGTPGRDCRGQYINAPEPLVTHIPTFKISANISAIDTPKATEYRAKKNGYVAFESDTYDIKDEMDIKEVSFKTTGSIETKLDADIILKIQETDVFKDAIGVGMSVEVMEINVEGNIGPKSKVHAKIAKIGGQTHKTSYVNADELTIFVHKGDAKGKHVHITRLENGSISGESVEIGQAIGGSVRARDVVIDLLGSNSVISATQSIEIKRMQGSENRFIIDPLAIDSLSASVNTKEQETHEIDDKMKEIQRNMEKYSILVKNNEKTFLEIKRKLISYKQNGIKMPESFVKQFQQFQKLQQTLKELREQYDIQKEKKERINLEINSVQDDIFSARVINRDRWVGYNEIRFKLLDPPMELVFSPREGSLDKVFGLFKISEDEYAIKAVKE